MGAAAVTEFWIIACWSNDGITVVKRVIPGLPKPQKAVDDTMYWTLEDANAACAQINTGLDRLSGVRPFRVYRCEGQVLEMEKVVK